MCALADRPSHRGRQRVESGQFSACGQAAAETEHEVLDERVRHGRRGRDGSWLIRDRQALQAETRPVMRACKARAIKWPYAAEISTETQPRRSPEQARGIARWHWVRLIRQKRPFKLEPSPRPDGVQNRAVL